MSAEEIMTASQFEAARVNARMQEKGIPLEERVLALVEAVIELIAQLPVSAVKLRDVQTRMING